MPISTSLSLQALLKAAIARSGMSVPATRIAGLTQAAQALAVAGARSRSATVLLVVPGDADVDQMTTDVRFFVAAIEGLSMTAVEQVVLPFPSLQIDPYRALAPHFRVASARARALHALGSGTARVVVASAGALLPRVSTPTRLLSASVELKPGQEISPQDLAAVLVDGGFTREDPVDEHGEYCVRGGIVDVYPAGEAQPARLEFVGDTIESIRRYDPATQRSITPLDQLAVVPLREVLDAPPASGSVFDYLPDDTAIYVSERDDVKAQALKVVDQISTSYEEVVGRASGGAARARRSAR